MPEALHEHAANQLRYIRETIERAGSFTAIPGWGGVAVGVIAVATTVVAEPFALPTPQSWLLRWLACAAAAAAIGWTAMAWKAKRAGVSLKSGVARRFFIAYFAPMGAGAVLTLALWSVSAFRVMPAVWLLLYGTSFVSSGAFSLRFVPFMGACFMACGVAAAFVALPVSNLILGLAFGGLHVGFGLYIARNYGG